MAGLKIKIAIVCAIAAAALVMLFVQQQGVKQLRQENEALKQQAAAMQEQLAHATQDAANASGGAATTQEEQTRELARLRNEVSQLRKSTNELARSRQEMQTRNQRLQTEAESSKNAVVAARTESLRIQNADTCIGFLRYLDSAKQQWALENRKQATDTPTADDLRPYFTNVIACPEGGAYTIGTVGEKPTCSVPGHELR